MCTIIAKNYLAHARVLTQSFRALHPEGRVFVLLVDTNNGYFNPFTEPFELIQVTDLGLPELSAMIARYDIRELCTAVKPAFLAYLLARFDLPHILYLDPDICCYGSLKGVVTQLETSRAVLTPHLLGPLDETGLPNEFSILLAGTYNLGFIGLRRDVQVDRFLRWWQERLVHYAHLKPHEWQHFDQKWVDFLPGFVDDVVISRHPGLNVAYWDLPHRFVERRGEQYLVNGEPLIFFHFSGYDPRVPEVLSRHQARVRLADEPLLRALFTDYRARLLAAQYETVSVWPVELPATNRWLGLGRLPTRVRVYQRVHAALQRLGLDEMVRQALAEPLLRPLRDRLIAPPSRLPLGKRPFGVNIIGHLHHETGVGEVARLVLQTLQRDVPVAWQAVLPGGQAWRVPYQVSLVHVNADMALGLRRELQELRQAGQRVVGFWWWELELFPAHLREAFSLFDELWVGSRFVERALASVAPIPVRYVGVPLRMHAAPTWSRAELGLPERGYLFVQMVDLLSHEARKNPAGTVAAFAEAFGQRSNQAHLVLKVVNAQQARGAFKRLKHAAAQVGATVIAETWPRQRLQGLLEVCDAYVSLHRAEGLGLTLLEAMLAGKPVIATAYGGTTDFMTEHNSYPIEYDLVSIGEPIGPYPAEAMWAEPHQSQAAAVMRSLVADPLPGRWRGVRARVDVREQYDPALVGARMQAALTALMMSGERRWQPDTR